MFGAHCPVNPLPQLAESKVKYFLVYFTGFDSWYLTLPMFRNPEASGYVLIFISIVIFLIILPINSYSRILALLISNLTRGGGHIQRNSLSYLKLFFTKIFENRRVWWIILSIWTLLALLLYWGIEHASSYPHGGVLIDLSFLIVVVSGLIAGRFALEVSFKSIDKLSLLNIVQNRTGEF